MPDTPCGPCEGTADELGRCRHHTGYELVPDYATLPCEGPACGEDALWRYDDDRMSVALCREHARGLGSQLIRTRTVLAQNKRLSDMTVHLRGRSWDGCVFTRCHVVLSGLPIALNQCLFNDCTWEIRWEILLGDTQSIDFLEWILPLIRSGVSVKLEGQGGSDG